MCNKGDQMLNQQQTKKIGLCYFYQSSQFFIYQHLIFQRQIRKMLSEKQWKINNYYQDKWNLVFQIMAESDVQFIKMDNINKGRKSTQNTFLKQITQVKLNNLQSISFYKCNICSIQSFSWLYAPNLRILQLTYNHIRTFKPLQKSSFMLQRLYIYTLENMGINLSHFSRMEQRIQILGLQFNELNRIVSQDLSFLAKIMFNHYRSFQVKIGFVSRIQQIKIQDKLKQKFKNYFQFHQNPNQVERYYTNDRRPIRKPQRYSNEIRNYQQQRRQIYQPQNNHAKRQTR